MTYTEILIVAFAAQLAVLPGEKVQFMIAALSTRYDPKIVVAAAASAFAGWTAVEIAFGRALQAALPGVVLDAVTAALFFAFAYLLYRSMPDRESDRVASSDGGTGSPAAGAADAGYADLDSVTLPGPLDRYRGSLGGFLPIFVLTATGEFGDKTQLVTIGLAAQYGVTSAIWVGEMLAIIPISLANAYFFHTFAHRFDVRRAHMVSAALFAFFGADTVLSIVAGVSVWETFIGAVSGAVSTLA
ncbi:TMEM165/GDT1 family protein [Halorubrum sp. SD626R]|jgi:putative Ca2+/H+ antiporter (TMEM165/GDT1 family)|uniref:TMEM165/GDT1 family protein n=1 Tax=Halorubrum sp. SD626R TaxID=1419722 RepID=UPI000ACE8D4E|nr:TMEM165/GDT1 family protein [Halorubrum sp. SD626R]TKX80672.1 TMEM165/GDT1 family protein [Halorubrum sp. SD626R]